MRDPKRINKMLQYIKEIWESNPDLRLGQLILNCVDQNFLYHIEDTDIISRMQEYYLPDKYMTLGKFIKNHRRDQQIGMRNFAIKASMCPSRMSKIERDRVHATEKEIKQISKNLGVDEKKMRSLNRKKLPPKPDLTNLLPVFVKTKDGRPLSDKELDDLIKLIKKNG